MTRLRRMTAIVLMMAGCQATQTASSKGREQPSPVPAPRPVAKVGCEADPQTVKDYWALIDLVPRLVPELVQAQHQLLSGAVPVNPQLLIDPTAENDFLFVSSEPVELSTPAMPAPKWLPELLRASGAPSLKLAVHLGPTEGALSYRAGTCVGVLHFVKPIAALRAAATADDRRRAREALHATCGEAMASACERKGCSVVLRPSCPGGTAPRPELESKSPGCACVCGPPRAEKTGCPAVQ